MKKNHEWWAHNRYALKKSLTIMKWSLFFIFIGCIQAFAVEATYAQKTKLELNFSQTNLEKVLNEIENQSEFFFLFNQDQINTTRKVDIQVKGAMIQEVLNDLFAGTDVKYTIIDRQIVLTNSSELLNQVNQGAQQQGKKVTGKVTDSSSGSLPGVSVVVKGTTTGVITDSNGNYSLSNIPENATLQFSFVGMKTQEIAVGGKTSINVNLADETIGLDEVVAIGYGTQKKVNLTGAISSIGSKELHSMATNDAGQALQGKAPVFTARNSGKPGEGTSIFLRGVGTMRNAGPLWIIDGVQGAPLDNFNDVETIQILKDAASAAIYGVQAANGVILVTTKKAHKGSISVNYNGYAKVNNAMGQPDLLNTQDYIDMYRARWKSNNPTLDDVAMQKAVKSFYYLSPSEVSKLPNTNWVNEMFRTGIDQVHTLSINGASDKSTYLISIMHENDEGTIVKTNYSKSSIKLNFSQEPTKWLKINESVNYRYSKRLPSPDDNSLLSGLFRGNPAMNVYDSTNPMGTGFGYFSDVFRQTIDWQGGNALESNLMKDYWEKSDQAWGNFQTIITPIKGLVWTTNISGKMDNSWSSKFNYNTFGGVSVNSSDFVSGQPIGNQFDYSQSGSRSYLFNSFANFDKSFGKHEIGLMVGAEIAENENRAARGYAQNGIPSQDLRTTQVAVRRDGYNTWGEGSRYSQFGRAVYSYHSKYLMTASFRNDATDSFAPGNRKAFFPSLSLGWNIANEAFFPIKNINDLKLRFGAGILGNDDIPSNLWRQEYKLQTNGTWAAQKVVNKDITWEKTTSYNIGLDLGIWQNAFTATVDVYNKETKDALLNVSLPSTTGFSSYYVNKGVIQNRGLELALGYKGKLNQLNYSLSGNMAYNENKVLDLAEASYLSGGMNNRTYTNGPVSAFYGFVAQGLYQSQSEIDALNASAVSKGFSAYDGNVGPGDIKFKDMNGDGTITSDKDQQTIGNPWPKIVYGLNINLEYQGFDLAMNWQGVEGIDIYNGLRQYTQNMFADWNSTSAVFDAWSPNNTGSSIPRLGNSSHNFGQSNSYMIEDGSYIRLKNLQLGYNINRSLISKLKLQKVRIYLGMENALTITKFSGFDPEFMSGSNYSRGVYGINQYPQSRSIIFGLQIGI